MDASKTELGRWGEKQAIRRLKRAGYRIIRRNVVSRVGEIDIVARDDDVLVFIEVKTRTSDEFGGPLEAVGPAKRRKLVQLARTYLSQQKIPECPCRFDVVGVTRIEGKKKPDIELVKHAFTLSGP